MDETSLDIYDSSVDYMDAGYLLGWANSGFASTTYLFVDDVSFFDSNPGWN